MLYSVKLVSVIPIQPAKPLENFSSIAFTMTTKVATHVYYVSAKSKLWVPINN